MEVQQDLNLNAGLKVISPTSLFAAPDPLPKSACARTTFCILEYETTLAPIVGPLRPPPVTGTPLKSLESVITPN